MIICILFCLIFAALFLDRESREKYVPAVVLKGLASLCFVILGIICSSGSHLAGLVITGLVLGCVADVLLNLRWVFQKKGQIIFLAGILVFLSGHILFLAAILPLSAKWIPCFAVGIVLTAALMRWIFKQITAKKAFKIFGVFFISALSCCSTAWPLAI